MAADPAMKGSAMRLVAASLFAILAASPASAEDFLTQAPVAAVTVYPDGAELVHRAVLDLPAGRHRIRLAYPGAEDLAALPRIRASDGVTLGALNLRGNAPIDREALFTPAQAEAWQTVRDLEDALASRRDEIATARAEVDALRARLKFLDDVLPGEGDDASAIVALADMLTRDTRETKAALVSARARLRPLREEAKAIAARLEDARAAFERLSPPADHEDVLAFDVDVATAGSVSFELTEFNPNAWWEMGYDLALDRAAGRLDIARKVHLRQDSGMAWADVSLTLATARPTGAVAPSEVQPDRARIEDPRTLRLAPSTDMATAPMAEVAPAPMAAAKTINAGLEIDGLSVSYVYPEKVTIADGEEAELGLDTLSLAARVQLLASPRHDSTAFVVADVTNTTPEPLLPGLANFLRDGHLVGNAAIDLIPAGAEARMGFGPIEGIRLATRFERNEEGDTGLISKSNTRAQKIVFTVENLTGEAQEVRALYPLPFSEQEDLAVRVNARPAPDETDVDHKRGVAAWDMTLAPGEKREVEITVSLSWPVDKELVWHP
ncbi:MAG: mucoidy inhibitor MuiA family protein [Alphaproteobacteria bacterium]|nr:MAG: mucoidy inhibitor MuiA family protein [Alphaproteobacteria bacterium]